MSLCHAFTSPSCSLREKLCLPIFCKCCEPCIYKLSKDCDRRPYRLEAFEQEFILCNRKNQPIRTVYQINTLFWLDSCCLITNVIFCILNRDRVPFVLTSDIKSANQNSVSNKYFVLIGQFWSCCLSTNVIFCILNRDRVPFVLTSDIKSVNQNSVSNKYFVLIIQFWSCCLSTNVIFCILNRDRVPFVLTSDMAYVINNGEKHNDKFQEFVDMCCQAFNILRKNTNLFLNLFALVSPCRYVYHWTLSKQTNKLYKVLKHVLKTDMTAKYFYILYLFSIRKTHNKHALFCYP